MKYINSVSGKGGTGKTLIAATLAEMLSRKPRLNVLLIDMDIFVRGLTSLLYLKYDSRRRLLERDERSVADILTNKPRANSRSEKEGLRLTEDADSGQKPGIHRFREFDMWPAVSLIDEVLDHNDIMPDNFDTAIKRIQLLKKQVELQETKYDFVILDSRAGYDELVAATHFSADLSINVEDDDPVSRVTATNLVSQLAQISGPPVYRLINKSRGQSPGGADVIGKIPFDVDIMNSYGSDEFWVNIKKSLLEPSLAEAWNRLSENENLDQIVSSSRRSPVQSEFVERRLSALSLFQRVAVIYGLLIGMSGLAYGFYGREIFSIVQQDPVRVVSLVMGIAGFVFALASLMGRSLK
jgi:septum site-determining protein MinD